MEKPHSNVLEYLILTFSKLLIVSNFMNFRSFEMPTFDSILKTTHWRIAASFVFWVWYFACQMYFECVSNHRDLSDVQNSSQCRIRTVEDFGNKMRGNIIFTNQGILVIFSEFLIFNENCVYTWDFVYFLKFSDFWKGGSLKIRKNQEIDQIQIRSVDL